MEDCAVEVCKDFDFTSTKRYLFLCRAIQLTFYKHSVIKQSWITKNLVLRAHVSFGQHQDTKLWNPQRSNECACLSHARAIERAWEWIAPFLQKRKAVKLGKRAFVGAELMIELSTEMARVAEVDRWLVPSRLHTGDVWNRERERKGTWEGKKRRSVLQLRALPCAT